MSRDFHNNISVSSLHVNLAKVDPVDRGSVIFGAVTYIKVFTGDQ